MRNEHGVVNEQGRKGRIPKSKPQITNKPPNSKHQTAVAGPEKIARETSVASQSDLEAWSSFGF